MKPIQNSSGFNLYSVYEAMKFALWLQRLFYDNQLIFYNRPQFHAAKGLLVASDTVCHRGFVSGIYPKLSASDSEENTLVKHFDEITFEKKWQRTKSKRKKNRGVKEKESEFVSISPKLNSLLLISSRQALDNSIVFFSIHEFTVSQAKLPLLPQACRRLLYPRQSLTVASEFLSLGAEFPVALWTAVPRQRHSNEQHRAVANHFYTHYRLEYTLSQKRYLLHGASTAISKRGAKCCRSTLALLHFHIVIFRYPAQVRTDKKGGVYV